MAALGGLTGVFLALLGLELLPRLAPPDLPRIAEGITLDGSALGFTSVIVLAVGIFWPRTRVAGCESFAGDRANGERAWLGRTATPRFEKHTGDG